MSTATADRVRSGFTNSAILRRSSMRMIVISRDYLQTVQTPYRCNFPFFISICSSDRGAKERALPISSFQTGRCCQADSGGEHASRFGATLRTNARDGVFNNTAVLIRPAASRYGARASSSELAVPEGQVPSPSFPGSEPSLLLCVNTLQLDISLLPPDILRTERGPRPPSAGTVSCFDPLAIEAYSMSAFVTWGCRKIAREARGIMLL